MVQWNFVKIETSWKDDVGEDEEMGIALITAANNQTQGASWRFVKCQTMSKCKKAKTTVD